MEIPIWIEGKREGTLAIEREGSVTLLTARLRDVGRVVRLSVFGEKEFYLGVPEPQRGELLLKKRLTGNAASSFPVNPSYCADKRREEKTETKRRVLWFGGEPHYF